MLQPIAVVRQVEFLPSAVADDRRESLVQFALRQKRPQKGDRFLGAALHVIDFETAVVEAIEAVFVSPMAVQLSPMRVEFRFALREAGKQQAFETVTLFRFE